MHNALELAETRITPTHFHIQLTMSACENNILSKLSTGIIGKVDIMTKPY